MKTALFILSLFVAGAAFALSENFDLETGPALPDGWTAKDKGWTVKGGALWKSGAGDRHFAIWNRAGTGSNISFEASVTVRRREAGVESYGWGVAGIAIHQDASNFWQLAFVEGPPNKGSTLYVELIESLDGVRQAQSAAGTKLKALFKEGANFAWEKNKPYRFRIAIEKNTITATITDADGKTCARFGYEFSGRAVTWGTPAAMVSNYVVVFDDLKAEIPASK